VKLVPLLRNGLQVETGPLHVDLQALQLLGAPLQLLVQPVVAGLHLLARNAEPL